MTMKSNILIENTLFLIFVALAIGCADRQQNPVLSNYGTLVYPPLKSNGLSAHISFYKIKNKNTGLPAGIDTVFTLDESDYLRTIVHFDNIDEIGPDRALIHLDWIGPDGRSFYTKRIDSLNFDATSILESSVSLSPDKREAGNYLLKVYYYRELIAQKTVKLLPENSINQTLAGKLSPEIVFCEKVGKKNGEFIGIDSVFVRDKKAKVRAYIHLNNIQGFKDSKLMFDIVWIGPDGEKFYSKDIELPPLDDEPQLYSSISIPPDKREPGKYALEVYLFDELIATKNFLLK